MSFKEKIDKILEANKLGINSISAFEDKIEAGRGAINDFYKENREPGRITLKRIKTFPGLSWEWWETGKGDVFITNSTGVEKAGDNKPNGLTKKETFYTDLIESNEEYSLIPRAVLKDYKIVPDKIIDVIIQSNENEKKALERSCNMEIESLNKKYELLIEGYENKINRLEREKGEIEREYNDLLKINEDLQRKIPAQTK